MERSTRARHNASHARSARARDAVATPYLCVIALGAAFALVAAALIGGGAKPARLASGDIPLFGASVTNTASLAQDTSEFGHMSAVRIYYPGLPGANAWTTGAPAAARSAVVVSFKALPTAILSGADDAALLHFFDTAPTGHPIYYSYYHEPEDNIAAGQFTLADYKAAWARVVALAHEAHNPDLHSTLILMEWDLSPKSGRNWRDYLPGGGIISTLGWDAYPVGSVGDRDPRPTPPAEFMGPAVAASNSVGLPFGFAEFGLATSSGRPAWLKEVGDYLVSVGAVFATLFNTSQAAPTMKLTDAGSIAVWRSFVKMSDPNVPPPPPNPTPAPAPPPSAVGISGMALRPATFTASGDNHATLTFTLTKAADVTICVLNSKGAVVRQLTRPAHAAGRVTISYYGYDGNGHREPAGRYQVLVVASNAQGSTTAEAVLNITAP